MDHFFIHDEINSIIDQLEINDYDFIGEIQTYDYFGYFVDIKKSSQSYTLVKIWHWDENGVEQEQYVNKIFRK
jgi:hypothetical protein